MRKMEQKNIKIILNAITFFFPWHKEFFNSNIKKKWLFQLILVDFALFNTLTCRLKPEIRVVGVDSHFNNRPFAEKAMGLLDEMMRKTILFFGITCIT